jgi:hypothetical protein
MNVFTKHSLNVFFLALFTLGLKSQISNREIVPLNQEELKQSEIISASVEGAETQKVMACAGNAANNNFANAQTLVVNGGNIAGTTCGTLEGGETVACYTGADNSVWYQFTATAATHYVQISHTSGGCYFGSAIYGTNTLPTTNCGNNGPISCQSGSGGPLVHLYHLTGLTIGNIYYIQILYNAGGVCGQNATFNIQVTTANPGGTITNKPPLATCAGSANGCFFNSPPTVNTVTSSCTSYPLSAAGYGANSVWSTVVQFTSSASWSNFSWQAIITSNCGGGNVVWLNWTLYDCSCNQLACGNISTLTGSGLACGTCYRLKYEMELANCSSFTTIWPYQNVPSSPQPCSVLPLNLLYFTASSLPGSNKVNVEWVSASEINLKEYNLYRSDDGINFRLLTTIKTLGRENKETKYNYEDVCCTGQETRYYKLTALENNGTKAFEKTIAVTFKGKKELVKFAPNPAQENFVIIFGEEEKDQETVLQIFDCYGKLIKEEGFVTPDGFKQFNIEEFKSGIYFINLIIPARTEVIKYKLVKE